MMNSPIVGITRNIYQIQLVLLLVVFINISQSAHFGSLLTPLGKIPSNGHSSSGIFSNPTEKHCNIKTKNNNKSSFNEKHIESRRCGSNIVSEHGLHIPKTWQSVWTTRRTDNTPIFPWTRNEEKKTSRTVRTSPNYAATFFQSMLRGGGGNVPSLSKTRNNTKKWGIRGISRCCIMMWRTVFPPSPNKIDSHGLQSVLQLIHDRRMSLFGPTIPKQTQEEKLLQQILRYTSHWPTMILSSKTIPSQSPTRQTTLTTILPYMNRGGSSSSRKAIVRRQRSTLSKQSNNTGLQHLVRGGGGGGIVFSTTTALARQHVPTKAQRKRIVGTATICGIIFLLWKYYLVWTPFLNKQKLLEMTLSLLDTIKPTTDNRNDWVYTMSLYTAGMALWEMFGLSTIPIETAAGMIFDFRTAAALSLLGKLLGAALAFTLGRTLLAQQVAQHSAFQTSTLFQLLNTTETTTNTTSHPPLLTAFLIKFSCFPELIKNFGSSLIPVVQPWMFVLATLVHGGGYTIVWTWLGVDTAKRLQDPILPINRALQGTLILAAVTGFVFTPLTMAWWVRDLQQQATEQAAVAAQQNENRMEVFIHKATVWFATKNTKVVKESKVTWMDTIHQWQKQIVQFLRETSLLEIAIVITLCWLLFT